MEAEQVSVAINRGSLPKVPAPAMVLQGDYSGAFSIGLESDLPPNVIPAGTRVVIGPDIDVFVYGRKPKFIPAGNRHQRRTLRTTKVEA